MCYEVRNTTFSDQTGIQTIIQNNHRFVYTGQVSNGKLNGKGSLDVYYNNKLSYSYKGIFKDSKLISGSYSFFEDYCHATRIGTFKNGNELHGFGERHDIYYIKGKDTPERTINQIGIFSYNKIVKCVSMDGYSVYFLKTDDHDEIIQHQTDITEEYKQYEEELSVNLNEIIFPNNSLRGITDMICEWLSPWDKWIKE